LWILLFYDILKNVENSLISIKNSAVSLILETKEKKELEEIQIQFLGRNGSLTQAIKEISKVPIEKRPEIGALANEVKKTLEETISQRQKELEQIKKTSSRKKIDFTNPAILPSLGHLHLVTQAIEEIVDIFQKIGFTKVSHPEVEWDWYAFEALNFPKDHPARDDWETFFIKQDKSLKYGPMVLTPHTSSGEIREMEEKKPPIRMLNIGKCYRRQSDVSHVPMFHQFEGLVIDKNISLTHLKGTLDYFVKSYFGKDRKSRIRPYQFQFTEPSLEIDVSCGVCNGKGCKLCKEGWLELGGAGMSHPNVLRNVKIDPDKYSGFAFGWGIERALMMKEGIKLDDIRFLYSNKLEFLEQF
jgi:phenylalanyl-tRNA synthetase alpha chain